MASRSPLPRRRSTASTASAAKWSLSCVRILLLSVVRAMFSRSCRVHGYQCNLFYCFLGELAFSPPLRLSLFAHIRCVCWQPISSTVLTASSACAEQRAAAPDRDPGQPAARAAAERQRAWRKRAGSPELFSDTASSRLPACSHASLYPAGHTKKGFACGGHVTNSTHQKAGQAPPCQSML